MIEIFLVEKTVQGQLYFICLGSVGMQSMNHHSVVQPGKFSDNVGSNLGLWLSEDIESCTVYEWAFENSFKMHLKVRSPQMCVSEVA